MSVRKAPARKAVARKAPARKPVPKHSVTKARFVSKTVVLFPEAAFGPALNCVGIAQALRDMGHKPVFVCDKGFKGVFEKYGFPEYPVDMYSSEERRVGQACVRTCN